MEPTQSALIVPVPAAEAAVGELRAALDRSAAWGVPAHITVLYPFLPPQRIDEEVLAEVADAVACVPRFDAALTRVGWFADTVLWLAPQPDTPFRELTAAVWRRFPDTPPYAGAHTDAVPHLTVGHDAPRQVLERAAAAVAGSLPIPVPAEAVSLITGTPGYGPWLTRCEFPLGDTVTRGG